MALRRKDERPVGAQSIATSISSNVAFSLFGNVGLQRNVSLATLPSQSVQAFCAIIFENRYNITDFGEKWAFGFPMPSFSRIVAVALFGAAMVDAVRIGSDSGSS